MIKSEWNKREEPISERLRDSSELDKVIVENTMMYNPSFKQIAIIMDVFEVDLDPDNMIDGYSSEEDRYVEYVTEDGPKADFSVDLDDEGWLWQSELKELK